MVLTGSVLQDVAGYLPMEAAPPAHGLQSIIKLMDCIRNNLFACSLLPDTLNPLINDTKHIFHSWTQCNDVDLRLFTLWQEQKNS